LTQRTVIFEYSGNDDRYDTVVFQIQAMLICCLKIRYMFRVVERRRVGLYSYISYWLLQNYS